jgi:SAM-dependent methyltransferase
MGQYFFTENEIKQFFNCVVKKSHSYFKKHEVLSNEDKSLLNFALSCRNAKWYDKDYPRVRTVLDFKHWIEKYSIIPKKIAYTFEDDPEMKLIKYERKFLINYDGVDGDLHLINYDSEFDFFLFNQTLEHLYNPFVCIKNVHKSLRSGGYVFTSVPVINIPHAMPMHFNGFTPLGLAMLFKVNGFEVLEIGQWGNYEYIEKLFKTHFWPGYSSLSEDGIRNEETNVVSCWILAKKL